MLLVLCTVLPPPIPAGDGCCNRSFASKSLSISSPPPPPTAIIPAFQPHHGYLPTDPHPSLSGRATRARHGLRERGAVNEDPRIIGFPSFPCPPLFGPAFVNSSSDKRG
ncbi:hypothetical protein B296_00027491 [Ensete ventricosum]|uniref:Secreted protein n=1 Tax=Ensete ventricosum TaxID=4639 RepID=A0A426ZDL5_ENSVE|nr:hypothetical protein B296_00027491 [Ensete ventricosum]